MYLFRFQVDDINDKSPFFGSDQYTISMSTGDEGRNLLTLQATDPDRYDTVTYDIDLESIDASNLDATVDTTNMFSIEKATGAIKIVHYPTKATRGYVSFTALATDGKTILKKIKNLMKYFFQVCTRLAYQYRSTSFRSNTWSHSNSEILRLKLRPDKTKSFSNSLRFLEQNA